jgi:ferredoxin
MPKVTFLNEQVTVEAKAGQTLLEVAQKSGINLFRGLWQEFHCSSNQGWCNRCKVWATGLTPDAINPRTKRENQRIRLNGALPKTGTMRLACQVVVSGDCEVRSRAGFERSATLEWAPDPRPFKWRERWEKRNDEPDEDEEKPKKTAPAKAAPKPAAAPAEAGTGTGTAATTEPKAAASEPAGGDGGTPAA